MVVIIIAVIRRHCLRSLESPFVLQSPFHSASWKAMPMHVCIFPRWQSLPIASPTAPCAGRNEPQFQIDPHVLTSARMSHEGCLVREHVEICIKNWTVSTVAQKPCIWVDSMASYICQALPSCGHCAGHTTPTPVLRTGSQWGGGSILLLGLKSSSFWIVSLHWAQSKELSGLPQRTVFLTSGAMLLF